MRLLAGLAFAAACQDLPEVRYETEHLELATDFDAPVCQGTLGLLDRATQRVVEGVAAAPVHDRFRVHWLEHTSDEACDGASGCFYANTRVVFARGRSIIHELTHATIDSPGDAFFVEEGIAELLGGAGARSDPARLRGRLAERLALSPRDYRHGELSYPEAAHFIQWLAHEEGPEAIHRLAVELASSRSSLDVRARLEDVLHASIDEIEARYVEGAQRTYPGTMDGELEEWVLHRDRGLWATLTLDCDDPEVLGPLPGARPGMYRAVRLVVTEPFTTRIDVDGDAGTFVELYAPYANDEQPIALWWPDDITGRIVRLEPGSRRSVSLETRTYLLLIAAAGEGAAAIDMRITGQVG